MINDWLKTNYLKITKNNNEILAGFFDLKISVPHYNTFINIFFFTINKNFISIHIKKKKIFNKLKNLLG